MDTVQPEIGDALSPLTPKHITPDPSVNDPPMFYPRPSSDRAQDVSHILASTFRDLYTRDVMGKDVVRNLMTSSEGSSEFHKKCMKQLKEAHDQHKQCLDDYIMLEQHIIQARARAVSADEQALLHVASESSPQKYKELGLPPLKSNFKWCLDEDLLRKHNLIVPSDLLPKTRGLVDGPKGEKPPRFAMPTLSSSMHIFKGPVDDGYISTEELPEETKFEQDDQSVTTLSTNTDALTNASPRKFHTTNKVKSEKSSKWQEHMSHDQRMIDRADLARMEERHNFLKNPRYLPMTVPKAARLLIQDQPKQLIEEAGRQLMKDTPKEEPVQVFIPKPNVVLFSEWNVGRVYEAVLELKNISFVSRQLRVIPPTTSFFSIGLGKYPGTRGLVAPGMSAQFNVRFMPDSLTDYEDYITVISQAEEPLRVTLRAKRNPPILTIPRNLHCGHCLVGGTKIVEIPVKNRGGSGRFCILKKTSWPAANFKTVVSPGSLDLEEFQIHPAVFELLAGQTMMMTLAFSPSAAEKYSEEVVMVCDNCQIQSLTIDGEGQSAAVDLLSVSDGGEDEPRLGEVSDMTADHLIRFPALNPHSFYTKQILIHNSINVEMPYTWHILKPNFQTSLRPDEQLLIDHFEFYPEDSPAFFIEPQRGVMQPNGIHEFVVTFAPHVVENYHNVLHLVLSNIPESSDLEKNQVQKDTTHTKLQSSAKIETVGRKSSATNNSNGASHLPKMEGPNKLSNAANNSTSKSSNGNLKEVIALEIELKGQSIPYAVLLHPPAIIVPGSVLEGTTVKRPFKMANYSLAPVQYEWSSETRPNIIQIEPPIGVIDPGDYVELEASITASKPGPLLTSLQCKVEHLEELLNLKFQANIEGPRIIIENALIDYGLVRLGDTVSEKVMIRNTTQLPALWSLNESDCFDEKSDLRISPNFGELSPLGQAEVKVSYSPKKTKKLTTILDLNIKDGKPSHLTVLADVQTPQACFVNCEVVCHDAYQSIPQVQKAFLLNLTSLTAQFQFGEIRGKHKQDCNVTVYPKHGVLAPREKLEIQITFSCHKKGEVSSLVLPCYVEGMDKPIALGFYANVKSLAVEYSTPDSNCDELKVLYEDPVTLGSVVTKKIVFENLTSIPAFWSTSVRHFGAKPPVPPSIKSDFKSAKTRRAMLGRTPNLADPMAKSLKQSLKDHKNLMLSSGLGAAFITKPSQGRLEPYTSQVVEVEAYSNMWGSYKDVIDCDIEGLSSKQIPVEMTVAGCPLSFQVVAGQGDRMAVIRFGTHINNGAKVCRKLRVNNSSPVDIRVDWRVYNTPEVDDTKLIDLNVWYGHPFPRKDSDGNEIVPDGSEQSSSIDSNRSEDYCQASPGSHSTERSANFEDCASPRDNRPVVVNVRLEPHHGQLSRVPFVISPDQSVVPAHGHVVVDAIFSPVLQNEDSTENKEWVSYVHGFMTLDDPNLKDIPDRLKRLDGYSIPALKLQMTALVRTGSLRVETDNNEDEDVEGIVFSVATSNMLILNSKVASEAVQYRNCTLLNDTEMPLDFKLSVSRPFFISSLIPTEGKDGRQTTKEIRLETSARNRLRPQDSIKVKIGFKLSTATLDTLKSLRNEVIVPGADLVTKASTGVENMTFQDCLDISFSNGTKQSVHLFSTVNIPHLLLSETNFDFGTCFVGKERCLQFKLQNIGEAHSLWNAFSELGEQSKNPECFRIEPSNGFLEGYSSYVARNKIVLSVFFRPNRDGDCSSAFNVCGVLGETPQKIFVRGVGSYDGKYEDE